MAAKKSAKVGKARLEPPPKGARGVALVEAVIASVQAGNRHLEVPVPEPVPAEVLGQLRFSDGSPLPPSLRRWLAFDGSWVARELEWFDDPSEPVLEARTVEELVRDDFGSEIWAPFYRELPAPVPRGLALPLEIASDSMRFYYLAGADADGEYPMMWLDTDDAPIFGVEAAGFDVWLAVRAGVVKESAYGDALKAARRRLTGGKQELSCEPPSEDSVAPPPRAPREKKVRVVPPFVVPPGLKGARLTKALEQALESRDFRKARAYLDAAKAQAPGEQTWKDLALAAAVGNGAADEVLVRELLAMGANPETDTLWGCVLRRTASHEGSLGALRALLASGADPNRHYLMSTTDFGSALHEAAQRGNLEGVKALLAGGAHVDETRDRGRTPLYEVCARIDAGEARAVAIADVLIDAGATVNWVPPAGGTPLAASVHGGTFAVTKALLARGADPNLTPPGEMESPLAIAWMNKRLDIYDVLREQGARLDGRTRGTFAIPDISTDDGRSPRVLHVRLTLEEAPQKVTLRVRSVRAPGTFEERWDSFVRWLVAWADAGAAGSDVFPPSAGIGRSEAPEWQWMGPFIVPVPAGSPFFEVERVFEIGGVAPVILAMWIQTIGQVLGPIAELSLLGEGSRGAGTAKSYPIDADQVVAWLRGEALEGPKLFPATPPFEITDRGRKGRVLAVWFASLPDGERLRKLDSLLGECLKRFGTLYANVKAEVTGATVVWKRTVVPGQSDAVVVPPVRATMLNALTKLGGVTRVEWSLGVPGDDGTPVGKGMNIIQWAFPDPSRPSA